MPKPLPDIPITFTHQGKEYTGVLSEVNGGGGHVWHLLVDNYYWGQLLFLEKRGFVFYAQNDTKALSYLAEYFGEVVTLWYG